MTSAKCGVCPLQNPVVATAEAVDTEADAVRAVGTAACDMRVVLERVIATSTGTVSPFIGVHEQRELGQN